MKKIKQTLRNLLPERLFLKLIFKKYMGYYPNLKNPQTLSEKTQWLKLNDRSELQTICADKFLVRDFISETIGDDYLVPLYFQSYNIDDLTKEKIPNVPCVLKTNHDNGGVFFIYDKNDIEWDDIVNHLKGRLKKNYYYTLREWQYKNIKPCIIVEKLLQDEFGNVPNDLKAYCFNGKVEFIQVDKDRGKSNQTRDYYTKEWNRVEFEWGTVKKPDYIISRPQKLDDLITLSEIIAKNFKYVRVDWYEVKNKLYFGEITFHPGGGFEDMTPKEYDQYYANMIDT